MINPIFVPVIGMIDIIYHLSILGEIYSTNYPIFRSKQSCLPTSYNVILCHAYNWVAISTNSIKSWLNLWMTIVYTMIRQAYLLAPKPWETFWPI